MADFDREALSLTELKKQQKAVAKTISTYQDRQNAEAPRPGLASSTEVDERYVQKQLGHASAEMTRRYQRRRDRVRVRVNLTNAAGLL